MLSDGNEPLGRSRQQCWVFLTKDARLENLSKILVAFTDLRPGSFVQIHSASASAITRDGDTCPSLGVSRVTVIVMNTSQPADGPGEDSGAHIPQGDTTAPCAAVAGTASAGTRAGEGTPRAGTRGGVLSPPGTTTPAVQAGVREDGVELSRLDHDRKRTDRLVVRTPAPRPFYPSVPPSLLSPSLFPTSPPVPRLACDSLTAKSPRRLTPRRRLAPPILSLPDGCANVSGSGIKEGPD